MSDTIIDDVREVLKQAEEPLGRQQVYAQSVEADSPNQVSRALWQLCQRGEAGRTTESPGRYYLINGRAHDSALALGVTLAKPAAPAEAEVMRGETPRAATDQPQPREGKLADVLQPQPEEIPAVEAWARNDELTRNLLLLVSIEAPLKVIASWSDETIKAVETWAADAYANASDNDVEPGPMPEILHPYQASGLHSPALPQAPATDFTQAPRLTAAEPAAAERPKRMRCALFSDGCLVIQRADRLEEFTREETEYLFRYLNACHEGVYAALDGAA